jgi:hypothetical protein
MYRLAVAVIASIAPIFLASCGSDCKTPLDCKEREICYSGKCTAGNNSKLACVIDDDCGQPLANGQRVFVCFLRRCTLRPGTTVATSSDAGSLDLGFADAQSSMDAMSLPDALPVPDATMSLRDTGSSTVADAGTSTVADAGTSTTADAGTSTTADGG